MNKRQAKKIAKRVLRDDGGHLRDNPVRMKAEHQAMLILARLIRRYEWRGADLKPWTKNCVAIARLNRRAAREIAWRRFRRGGQSQSNQQYGYGSPSYKWQLLRDKKPAG